MRSKAKKIHFQHPKNIGPICGTKHGHKITLTNNQSLVTCDTCKIYLYLHTPEDNEYPNKTQFSKYMEQLTLF